jgi:hypothetical protein
MYTVTWTIELNEGASRQDILLELEASKVDYESATGLITAIFGFSSDNKSVIEISMWDSEDAARHFFTPHFETIVSRRWQAAPMSRLDWETPSVIQIDPAAYG